MSYQGFLLDLFVLVISVSAMRIQTSEPLQWSAVAPLQPSQLKNTDAWPDFIYLLHRRVVVSQLRLPQRRLLLLVRTGPGLSFPSSTLSLSGSTAGGRHPRDQPVQRLHGAHPARQEVPRLELGGQATGTVSLHHIDHGDEDAHPQEWGPNAGHHSPAGHRQAQHQRRQQQEAQEQVEDGEPAVLGCALTQDTRHPDGEAQGGEGVPEQDAQDVEEEVAEGDLCTAAVENTQVEEEVSSTATLRR